MYAFSFCRCVECLHYFLGKAYLHVLEHKNVEHQTAYNLLCSKLHRWTEDDHRPVFTETGRLFVGLVKGIAINKGVFLCFISYTTPLMLLNLLNVDSDALELLLKKDAITILVHLVTGAALVQPTGDVYCQAEYGSRGAPYPIVQNEGLVGLLLLCQGKFPLFLALHRNRMHERLTVALMV